MAENDQVAYTEFLAIAADKKVQEILKHCRNQQLPEKGALEDESLRKRGENILTRIDIVFKLMLGGLPLNFGEWVLDTDVKKHVRDYEDKSRFVVASLLAAEALKISLCPPRT